MTAAKKPTTSKQKSRRPEPEPTAGDERHMLALFAKRLTQVLDSRGYAPIMAHRCMELADEFAVSPAGVRKWLVGDGMPSSAMMKTIAEKLAVSIDWLFDVSLPVSPFVPDKGGKSMPAYSAAKSFDSGTPGIPKNAFNLKAVVSVSNVQLLGCPEEAHTFCVECWVDALSAGVQRGDLLICETALHRIADGQVYLLRSGKGTTFVRRATIELNETVTFRSVPENGKGNAYASSQIIYARSFDEDGTSGAITILGRVIGMCRIKF